MLLRRKNKRGPCFGVGDERLWIGINFLSRLSLTPLTRGSNSFFLAHGSRLVGMARGPRVGDLFRRCNLDGTPAGVPRHADARQRQRANNRKRKRK